MIVLYGLPANGIRNTAKEEYPRENYYVTFTVASQISDLSPVLSSAFGGHWESMTTHSPTIPILRTLASF